jgi:hypothetical protein
LKVQKQIFCATLEPPDKLNEKSRSSIPTGQYICRRYSSAAHPDTFQITNVPGRDYVLFHAGNSVADTEGCPLLGQYHGKLASHERAVLNSGQTFTSFMRMLAGEDEFHLTIREVY